MEKIKDYKDLLQINTKINVTVRNGEYEGVYDSRIEDITKDGIYISIPTLKGVPFLIRSGSVVDISFVANGGRFSFQAEVEGRVKDGINMLKLKKPPYIHKSELRRYFRIGCRLKITISRLLYQKSNGNVTAKIDAYEATVKDISGGGVRIQVAAEFQEDDVILLDFKNYFPTINEIFGKVVKIFPKNENLHEYGVEFISIKERDRDLIIKYVFMRQIELKKLT